MYYFTLSKSSFNFLSSASAAAARCSAASARNSVWHRERYKIYIDKNTHIDYNIITNHEILAFRHRFQ